MNNTDKLLRAFIEASGFEVTKEFDQRKYNYEVALANERNEAPILTKADFTDYKVTKKKGYLPLYEMMYRSVMCGTCYANRNICNCEKIESVPNENI